MIRVILCDDHAVVRRGIRDTLADATDIQVVGEAGSYSEVREVLRERLGSGVFFAPVGSPRSQFHFQSIFKSRMYMSSVIRATVYV